MLNDHNAVELPEIFTREQIEILESTFHHQRKYSQWQSRRNELLFLVNYHLALRPLECVNLKILDIDFKNKVVYVPPANKIHKGRIIAVPEFLLNRISDYLMIKRPYYLKDRNSPYLFPSKDNAHISRDRWNEIFRDILKITGIWKLPRRGYHGHYTIYTLRHTKATEVYAATGDINLVADMLGHKSLETVKVYIHLSHLKDGYMDYMRKAMISSMNQSSSLKYNTQDGIKNHYINVSYEN